MQGELQAGGAQGTDPLQGGAGAPLPVPVPESCTPAGTLRGSSFVPQLCSESGNWLQIYSRRQKRGKLFIHSRVESRGSRRGRCGCSAPLQQAGQGQGTGTGTFFCLHLQKRKGIKPRCPTQRHRQPAHGRQGCSSSKFQDRIHTFKLFKSLVKHC